MAFSKQRESDFATVLLITALFVIHVKATENIDCNGKAFHCVNSTHFKICVDFGGVSKTVDDFLIPCPPMTVCTDNNYFECEYFQIPTTSAAVSIQSDVTNELYKTTVPSPWELFEVTTLHPINNHEKSIELLENSNIAPDLYKAENTETVGIVNNMYVNDVTIKTQTIFLNVSSESGNNNKSTSTYLLGNEQTTLINYEINDSSTNDSSLSASLTSEAITINNSVTTESAISNDLFNTVITASSYGKDSTPPMFNPVTTYSSKTNVLTEEQTTDTYKDAITFSFLENADNASKIDPWKLFEETELYPNNKKSIELLKNSSVTPDLLETVDIINNTYVNDVTNETKIDRHQTTVNVLSDSGNNSNSTTYLLDSEQKTTISYKINGSSTNDNSLSASFNSESITVNNYVTTETITTDTYKDSTIGPDLYKTEPTEIVGIVNNAYVNDVINETKTDMQQLIVNISSESGNNTNSISSYSLANEKNTLINYEINGSSTTDSTLSAKFISEAVIINNYVTTERAISNNSFNTDITTSPLNMIEDEDFTLPRFNPEIIYSLAEERTTEAITTNMYITSSFVKDANNISNIIPLLRKTDDLGLLNSSIATTENYKNSINDSTEYASTTLTSNTDFSDFTAETTEKYLSTGSEISFSPSNIVNIDLSTTTLNHTIITKNLTNAEMFEGILMTDFNMVKTQYNTSVGNDNAPTESVPNDQNIDFDESTITFESNLSSAQHNVILIDKNILTINNTNAPKNIDRVNDSLLESTHTNTAHEDYLLSQNANDTIVSASITSIDSNRSKQTTVTDLDETPTQANGLYTKIVNNKENVYSSINTYESNINIENNINLLPNSSFTTTLNPPKSDTKKKEVSSPELTTTTHIYTDKDTLPNSKFLFNDRFYDKDPYSTTTADVKNTSEIEVTTAESSNLPQQTGDPDWAVSKQPSENFNNILLEPTIKPTSVMNTTTDSSSFNLSTLKVNEFYTNIVNKSQNYKTDIFLVQENNTNKNHIVDVMPLSQIANLTSVKTNSDQTNFNATATIALHNSIEELKMAGQNDLSLTVAIESAPDDEVTVTSLSNKSGLAITSEPYIADGTKNMNQTSFNHLISSKVDAYSPHRPITQNIVDNTLTDNFFPSVLDKSILTSTTELNVVDMQQETKLADLNHPALSKIGVQYHPITQNIGKEIFTNPFYSSTRNDIYETTQGYINNNNDNVSTLLSEQNILNVNLTESSINLRESIATHDLRDQITVGYKDLPDIQEIPSSTISNTEKLFITTANELSRYEINITKPSKNLSESNVRYDQVSIANTDLSNIQELPLATNISKTVNEISKNKLNSTKTSVNLSESKVIHDVQDQITGNNVDLSNLQESSLLTIVNKQTFFNKTGNELPRNENNLIEPNGTLSESKVKQNAHGQTTKANIDIPIIQKSPQLTVTNTELSTKKSYDKNIILHNNFENSLQPRDLLITINRENKEQTTNRINLFTKTSAATSWDSIKDVPTTEAFIKDGYTLTESQNQPSTLNNVLDYLVTTLGSNLLKGNIEKTTTKNQIVNTLVKDLTPNILIQDSNKDVDINDNNNIASTGNTGYDKSIFELNRYNMSKNVTEFSNFDSDTTSRDIKLNINNMASTSQKHFNKNKTTIYHPALGLKLGDDIKLHITTTEFVKEKLLGVEETTTFMSELHRNDSNSYASNKLKPKIIQQTSNITLKHNFTLENENARRENQVTITNISKVALNIIDPEINVINEKSGTAVIYTDKSAKSLILSDVDKSPTTRYSVNRSILNIQDKTVKGVPLLYLQNSSSKYMNKSSHFDTKQNMDPTKGLSNSTKQINDRLLIEMTSANFNIGNDALQTLKRNISDLEHITQITSKYNKLPYSKTSIDIDFLNNTSTPNQKSVISISNNTKVLDINVGTKQSLGTPTPLKILTKLIRKEQKVNQRPIELSSKNDETTKLKFNCKHRHRGKYSEKNDCQSFYICIGRNEPIFGKCPNNTVFSEILKQCTKNLSHCIRNYQFQCTSVGRYIDMLSAEFYYICAKKAEGYVRFKLKCQRGYHLDKSELKCILNSLNGSISKKDNSKADSEKNTMESNSKENSDSKQQKQDFECKKEGKFGLPDDCRKYYQCTKNNKSEFRRKIKKCDSDEVFNDKKRTCVDDVSYESKE